MMKKNKLKGRTLMKIKTKRLPYEQVMALPRPAHQAPRKPSRLLGRLIRSSAAS